MEIAQISNYFKIALNTSEYIFIYCMKFEAVVNNFGKNNTAC